MDLDPDFPFEFKVDSMVIECYLPVVFNTQQISQYLPNIKLHPTDQSISIYMDGPFGDTVIIHLLINGWIQLYNYTTVSYALWSLDKLLTISIKDSGTPSQCLSLNYISQISIQSITCIFNIGFRINLVALKINLLDDHYQCYYRIDKQRSLYLSDRGYFNIFPDGTIVVIGHDYHQMNECYQFINQYLIDKFMTINCLPNLTKQLILNFRPVDLDVT